MSERLVDSGALHLVGVCLFDERAGEVSDVNGEPVLRPLVVNYLHPEARELAFSVTVIGSLTVGVTGLGGDRRWVRVRS
jgi:hypothetical protein